MNINNKTVLVIAVLAAIILVLVGLLVFANSFNGQNNQTACTMEAMLCPDGSAVGRTGPNCEFAKCPDAATLAFGTDAIFTIGQEITLSDGLNIKLEKINDSRCQPGVVCVWAGELSAVFTLSGGGVGDAKQEITLGTQTAKKVTKYGYIFELKEATEMGATVIIDKESKPLGNCYIGGCSSEICSDKEGVVSTCMYKPEYACYKTAACQRQQNGQCGWTQTPALTSCLASSRNSEYVCALPCTGAAPDQALGMQCQQQTSQATCDAVTSNKFPYKCQWRAKDYVCPPLP